MASTRVVLPWSTWAIMAMLRMDEDKSASSSYHFTAIRLVHHRGHEGTATNVESAALNCGFDQFGGNFGMGFGAGSHAIPGYDRDERKQEDDGGNGIDFGRNAAAEAAPDFEGQGIVTADQEK